MKQDEPFFIVLRDEYFAKNEIVKYSNREQARVVKVYKRTWWRKLLTWFGFDVGLVNHGIKYKVKPI